MDQQHPPTATPDNLYIQSAIDYQHPTTNHKTPSATDTTDNQNQLPTTNSQQPTSNFKNDKNTADQVGSENPSHGLAKPLPSFVISTNLQPMTDNFEL